MLVDSNDVTDPLVERVEREGTEITHILLTHHHFDHVVGVEKLAERFGAPVVAHELCAEQRCGHRAAQQREDNSTSGCCHESLSRIARERG